VRILQLTPGYYPVIGGVERHVQALAERLVSRGHAVTVGTMQPHHGRLKDETHNGVSIRRFNAWGLGDAYRAPVGLLGFLRATRNNWDIVHVHNYHALLIPIAALAGVRPLVVTTHLNDVPHSGVARLLHVPYTAIGRWAVKRAEAVVCVTEAEARRVRTRLGVAADQIAVIPNGVSEALIAARGQGVERDPHLLLAVGRLQPYKRVDRAIDMLAELGAPYTLAVVGDGPQAAALEAQARNLGVADRVVFAGKAGDAELVDWYQRAAMVVSLSEAEAFGMTVLEGLAAGCHVVCSGIPAFRDLAAQFNGHVTVVEDGSPGSGAAAVRARIEQRPVAPPDVSGYTWDAVAERLLAVYENVTSAGPRVAGNDEPQGGSAGGESLLAGG
jgi:glycosyltransferase involved in cell wall biosynthesis